MSQVETKVEPKSPAQTDNVDSPSSINQPHFNPANLNPSQFVDPSRLSRDQVSSHLTHDPSDAESDSSSDTNTRASSNIDTKASSDVSTNVLVTVVMPCLNESLTVGACIDQAHAGCQAALQKRNVSPLAPSSGRGVVGVGGEGFSEPSPAPNYTYEIIIADNGSSDGSQAIAEAHGARVVHVAQKGYGAALLGGIAAARGKYIVMGDSDCSYDFGDIPRFLDKLEEGYDLVMGNRFAGGIKPGAMPWHHRYIGNPILSGIGRLLYRTPCRDWHCGLRAFDRQAVQTLNLKSPGMEFASEMVIRFSQSKSRISEVSTTLSPDGRDRPPHLRSIRDGLRHLGVLVSWVH